jgi:hypothetical protein
MTNERYYDYMRKRIIEERRLRDGEGQPTIRSLESRISRLERRIEFLEDKDFERYVENN